MRLDRFLQKNHHMSRARAQLEIKAGHILINGKKNIKPSTSIIKTDSVEITERIPFVARSGKKLAEALKSFHIESKNKIALDVGSSTGGFVDCLLQNGAQKVVAVDVGTLQLHESLKGNQKVELHENTDIRNYTKAEELNFDIIVIDISFISILKIIEKIKELSDIKTDIIVLIKPQFETEKEIKTKAGVLTENQSKKILEKVLEKLRSDFKIIRTITSPITGKKGNTEYLAYIKNSN